MTARVGGECGVPGEGGDYATRSTINLAMDTNLCISKNETFTRTTHIEDNGRSVIATQEEGDGRSSDNIDIAEHVKGTNYCQCIHIWIASACERLHIPYFRVTKRMCLYPHKKTTCTLTVECTQQRGVPK